MAMNDSAVCYLSFQRLYPSGILTLKKGGFFLRAVFSPFFLFGTARCFKTESGST